MSSPHGKCKPRTWRRALRKLVLAVYLFLAATGRGQEGQAASLPGGSAPAAAEPAPPAPAPGEARTGDSGIFLLRSGARLAGRLVARGADGDVIELRSGERVHLAAGSVVGRVGTIDAKAAEPEPPAQRVRVFLRDGRTVEGDLLEQDASRVRIRTPDGETQEYRTPEVREVFHLSELRSDKGGLPDPARGHYLYVPSAFGLGAGTYQVSATTVAVPTLAYGITGWLSVSAGLIAPLMYGTPIPELGVTGAVTASVEALSWLRVAGGVQATSGQGGTAVLLFGAVTAGTPALNLSLYAGPPMPEAERLGRFDEVIVAVAGGARMSRRTGLLLEAWVTPRFDSPEALVGLAFRAIVGEHLALDVGAMATTGSALGPWLSVCWTDAWRGK